MIYFYKGTTLPLISLLGNFTSKMLVSKLGYITWLDVAESISYAYWEYPFVVPALLEIIIFLTV